MSIFHQVFYTCYLWLCPLLKAMNTWFCGWRHVVDIMLSCIGANWSESKTTLMFRRVHQLAPLGVKLLSAIAGLLLVGLAANWYPMLWFVMSNKKVRTGGNCVWISSCTGAAETRVVGTRKTDWTGPVEQQDEREEETGGLYCSVPVTNIGVCVNYCYCHLLDILEADLC